MPRRQKPTPASKRPTKSGKSSAKSVPEVKVLNTDMLQSMSHLETTPVTPSELQVLKATFITTISGSILREPKLLLQPGDSKSDNFFTTELISQSRRIALYDPEFLLKAALYARTRLNLRSVTAFLLSLSALIRACHPYLPRYFNAAVLLPSDWLDVVRRYRVLHATLSSPGAPDLVAPGGSERSLPSCLRKSLISKFAHFDEYQLGKYNPQRSNARKRRKLIEAAQEKARSARGDRAVLEQIEQETRESERNLVDFKGMIRELHIAEPAEYVMSVLGKRYPSSEEEYRRCRLSGVFLEERAGQRMKLPVPDTWETYLSKHGNTAATWAALVSQGKLPFMAMLRNIRNLLLCGVGPRVHSWVLGKLRDARSVAASRQLPSRFVAAYQSVPATLEGFAELLRHAQNPPQVERAADGAMVPRRPRAHVPEPETPPTQELLTQYREALETAIQLATSHNIAPIRGKSLILCECVPGFKADRDKFRNTALLLALMCRSVCESCDMRFVDIRSNKVFALPDDEKGDSDADESSIGENEGIIARLERANRMIEGLGGKEEKEEPTLTKFVHTLICERKWVDTIVYFGSMGVSIENDVNRLRSEVNGSMLFFAVNPEGRAPATAMSPRASPADMNVHVAGASDSVLRYIAELGNANQLEDVEHINREFAIVTDDIPPPPLPSFITKDPDEFEWHTDDDENYTDEDEKEKCADTDESGIEEEVAGTWKEARIFVSSTFVDMHGERDLITRIVYPELAKRCEEHKIRLSIVDLRWGITEGAAPYAIGGERRPNPQRCLEIVGECAPLFVGFVGERYGWHPAPGEPYPIDTEDPRFAWVAGYPLGRSATELEMYLGCAKDRNPHAFFYFRDPAFVDAVPKKYKKCFAAESKAAAERVAALKSLIRGATNNVVTYPAAWGGVVNGVPVAKCSNALKRRLFNDMWAMIKSVFAIKESGIKKYEIEKVNQNNNNNYNNFAKGNGNLSGVEVEMAQRAAAARLADDFVGRADVLEELSQWAADESGRGSICALSGPSGSGVSSLCAVFASRCRAQGLTVVEHHASSGGAGGCATLRGMLTRLCLALEKGSASCPLGGGSASRYASLGMRDLEARFAELLEEASYTSRTVVVIDSPDDLAADDGDLAHSLGWLPARPPARGCRVLLALRAGGECEAVLRAKYPPSGGALRAVEVPPLGHDDARALVRATLERYRKRLNETGGGGAAGNQMGMLLGKADAGLPLYLKLACEELRVFGVYEALSARIKAMSPTLPGLVDEVLSRLESDHGRTLVANALTSLALSRQGLYEGELLRILAPRRSASPVSVDSSSTPLPLPLPLLSQGRWAPLSVVLRAARFVAQAGPGLPLTIAAAPAAVRAVVERRYLTPDFARRVHARIAECLAAPGADEARRVGDVAHHYVRAGLLAEAAALLTSLAFVRHKIALGMGPGLLSDYAEYLVEAGNSAVDVVVVSEVREFRDFVAANMHALALDPSLTHQLAANEPDATAPAKAARGTLDVDGWVKWINKPQQCGLRRMRLGGSGASSSGAPRASATTCVAFSPALVAYGSNDCGVRVHDRATGKLVATLTQHSAAVSALAFSDDGEALAAGAWDGAVWVWSTRSWAAIPAPLRAPKSQVATSRRIAALAFPPGSCTRVLGASWDSNIYIWDFALGGIAADPTCYVLTGHTRPVSALSIAGDGRHAASAAWDGSVRVWDISERKMLGELPRFSGSIRSLAWRPDSAEQLIVAAASGSVELWNIAPPVRLARISDGTDPVNAALYCGDAAVATGAEDGALRLWAASSTKPLWGEEEEEEEEKSAKRKDDVHALVAPPKMLALSGDGRVLVAPAGDCAAYLWSVGVDEDRTLAKRGRLVFHKKVVNAAAVESAGGFVVTGSDDGNVVLWNGKCLESARRCSGDGVGDVAVAPKVLYNAGCPVNDVALLKRCGDNVVLCALENSTVVVLDCKNGIILGNLKGKGHTDSVLHVTTSPDASLIASASLDGTVCIWDAHTYAHIHTISAHKDWVTGLLFTPDSRHLITSSLDSRCHLFDARRGSLLRAFPRVPGPVTSLALSPGGTFLAAACSSGSICVWDRAAGFLLSTIACPADAAAPALCFLGERALAAAVDGRVLRAWRLLCPHELVRLAGHNGPVRAAALSPDAKELATAADDGAVCLWDVERALDVGPAQMRWQAQNHTTAVTAAAFAEDGRTFVTAAADGSLKMWDAAAACVRTFYPSGEAKVPVRAVAFGAEGSALLVGDARGSVYVLDPSGATVEELPGASDDAISDIRAVSGDMVVAASWGNTLVKLCRDDAGVDGKEWSVKSVRCGPREKVSALLRCGVIAACDSYGSASFYDLESLVFVCSKIAQFTCTAHVGDRSDILVGADTGSPTLKFTLVAPASADASQLGGSRDPRVRAGRSAKSIEVRELAECDVGAPVVAAEFARSEFERGSNRNVLVVATADNRVTLYAVEVSGVEAEDTDNVCVSVEKMGVFMTKAKPSVVAVSPVSQAIVVGDVLGMVYLLKYVRMRK